MIVLSAGLPKSGSGLLFNLTNDLLEQSGQKGIRRLRDEYGLQDLLKNHNCNIGEPNWAGLRRVLPLHFRGHQFTVKTHRGPNRVTGRLARLKILRATYVFRDPRDVVLSALDHGRKLRAAGQSHTFADCHTVEDTIPKVMKWLEETSDWVKASRTLVVRYEELTAEPIPVLNRLCEFLGIDPVRKGIDLKSVFSRYDAHGSADAQTEGLHWNKGVAGRFRKEMSGAEISLCNSAFGDYLHILGYEE